MEHFPSSVIGIISLFAPYFMANNFIYFRGFMRAYMLLGQSRKTVTNMARVCFFIDRHVASVERFLSNSRWDLSGVKDCLVSLIRARLEDNLLIHGAYLLWLDTFLISKIKGKMVGVQKWHDHSGNPDRGDHLTGHHWAIAGLIGFGMVGTKLLPLAFPVLADLVSGQLNPIGFVVNASGEARLMNFWDTVCPLMDQLRLMLGHHPIRVVADAYFSKSPFINRMLSLGIHVISRMRSDAVAWEDPEPSVYAKKRRGRKRKHPPKGKKWKLSDLLTHFPLESVTVSIYGKVENFRLVCQDLRITGVESRKVRIVVIKTKGLPFILISTDMLLSASQIIEIFGRRFMGELVIRDLKQYFGLGDYQCTGLTAIFRYVALAMIGFALWRLILINNQDEWLISPDKTAPSSFGRISRSLRGYVMRKIFRKFALDANFHNSVSTPDELIKMIV
jgi:hypothetical protein